MIELKIDSKDMKDFLSVDRLTAISSEGGVFHVGDKVKHEGDPNNLVGTIARFTLDNDTVDVVAHSEHGSGRISFLYH
jgi:hypothetical protein